MSCTDYEEQINLLIDGGLEESRHSALYSHLEECSECRSLFDGILRVRQTLKSDRPPFPEELDSAVLAAISGDGSANHRLLGRPLRVPLPLAAAAVIVLAAAAFFLGRTTKSAPPAQTRDSQAALVTTSPRIEILYGLPSIEVVGYSSSIQKTDSGKTR